MINMLLMLQYSSVKYPYTRDNMSIVTKFNQEKPTKTGQLPSELYEKKMVETLFPIAFWLAYHVKRRRSTKTVLR